MATSQTKLCVFFHRGGLQLTRNAKAITPATFEGQRCLSAHPDYKKPFPYETKQFGFLNSLMDFTTARFNENTRIIMIEGLPGVGKTEFAGKIANHFKLVQKPAIEEKDLYEVNGFDVRKLNDLFTVPKLRIADLAAFYAEKDPSKIQGAIATSQTRWLSAKYFQYCSALRHVLNTGQGVVLENSIWSDVNYAMALKQLGYYPKKGYKHYEYVRKNALNFLWKPHLIIYLDAPTELIIERMKQKNPALKDSPVLNTQYINLVKENYEHTYLPYMRKYCEVLAYDVTTMDDFDLLSMDLEAMDLMNAKFGDPDKYADWRKSKEEEFSIYRLNVSDDQAVRHGMTWRAPWEVPELFFDGSDYDEFKRVWHMVPELRFQNLQHFFLDKVSPLDNAKGSYLDPTVN